MKAHLHRHQLICSFLRCGHAWVGTWRHGGEDLGDQGAVAGAGMCTALPPSDSCALLGPHAHSRQANGVESGARLAVHRRRTGGPGEGCGWGRGVPLWGARPCASSNWAMPNHCGPSTPRKQLTMWEKGSGGEWGSEKGPTAHTRTNECVHSGSDEPHHNGKRPEAAQWTASKARWVRLDRGMCATHKRGGGGGGGDGRMVQRATGGQEGGAHHNSVPRGGHSHAWTRPAEKWASRRSHTTLMAVGWGERCTGREGARGTNSKFLRAFFYVVAAH